MQYIKGTHLIVADALSRASLEDNDPEIEEEELKYYVHSVVSNYLISDERLKQFQHETEIDETLTQLKIYIDNGWPLNHDDIPQTLLPYYNIRLELSILNGLVMKENRIVVPTMLRKEMKKLLHAGHLGIVKIKGRARETIYWPGITSHIEEMVKTCDVCQQFQNKQRSESMLAHEIPDTPWSKVGTDIFTLNSKDYLIIVDYTTNYYDISLLTDKQSRRVVTQTKIIFSWFGIPKIVISDNGPEFSGEAYKKFSKEWDFEHITSSPVYPESNGQIERTIQTVKKTLKKALKNNEDPYLALLAIRVCPGPYNNVPPATIFFNRHIPSTIPTMNTTFKKTNKKLNRDMKTNKKGRDLCNLNKNDIVRIHDGKSWGIKGEIIAISKNLCSY